MDPGTALKERIWEYHPNRSRSIEKNGTFSSPGGRINVPSRRIVIYSLLLLAILALAALLAPLVPSFRLSRQSPSPILTSTRLAGLHAATIAFHSHTGEWPSSLNELVINKHQKVFHAPPGPSGFLDGWHQPFIFQPFNTNRGYGTILSYGRDGLPGGAGPDVDTELRFPQ